MLRIDLIFGMLALCPSGLGAATFAFALRPEGTRLAGEFALAADAAGSLRGDYDPSTNAGGTRTKPGLFGSFGSTENLPVPVELTSALSGPLDSKPTGGFQLQLNEEAGTIILSGLSLNLLPGDPVVVPSELVIEFGSFRTRSPDSLFIGGFPLTVPLGEARLTSLAAAQIGSAAGDLSAASIGLWDFSISTLLLVSGSFESTLGETLLPPVPVPYTLSGRISMSGDSAVVTAASDFGFSQSTDVGLELPSLPFDLPTILPAGGSANVLLELSLNALVAELDATLTLAAPGRAIPEPASAALTVGGLLWVALQRRRSRAISIRQKNRLVLFLSFGMINASVKAAPVNDAYGSALILPAALPLEASGTTVAATLEAQETFPTVGGKSVWWAWTPAVSGWVQLSVAESALDPVVSLFGGASATLPDRIAWNDDAGSGLETSASSELIFPASAGRTYHIQIGGYGGSEGPISLKLQAIAAPPEITTLSFQPVAVDVTAQPGLAVVTVGIAHAPGFTGGNISLYRPDGVEEVLRTFGASERITGNSSAGTYQITLPIRQKVLAGQYPMRVQVTGNDGTKTVYGERTPFPDALPHSIPVVNQGVIDDVAPAVISLALSAAVADVTTVEKSVAVTVRLADQVSGINDFSSSLEVRTPLGEVFFGDLKGAESNKFSRRNRTSGNGFDGTYTISVIVPAGTPPGDYPLALHLVDSLGNRISHGPATAYGEVPLPPPFPTHLTVVNTGTVDQTPPVLTGVTLTPATVNVAEFQSFVLTVNATDARSGTASVALSGAVSGLQPIQGGAVVPIQDDLLRSSGTPLNGVYKTTITPPYATAPGVYRVVGITLTDALENERSYGPAGLGLTAFPNGINPLLTITNQPLPGPYQTWLTGYPSLTGPLAVRTADPDGDGLPNLVELALGTNPTLPNTPGSGDPKQGNVPVFRRVGNRLYMDYNLTSANLGTDLRGISVDAQESSDLRTWDSAIRLIGGDGYSAYITITPGEKKWIRLMVYDPAADLGR